MSRGQHDYTRRGCSIGSEIAPADNVQLVETEPDALFEHWRKMAMITLQATALDLDKLSYCLLRMRFWQARIDERANR
jgi:hypothetical protein